MKEGSSKVTRRAIYYYERRTTFIHDFRTTAWSIVIFLVNERRFSLAAIFLVRRLSFSNLWPARSPVRGWTVLWHYYKLVESGFFKGFFEEDGRCTRVDRVSSCTMLDLYIYFV